jgi:ABC-2 type transport system permease protein
MALIGIVFTALGSAIGSVLSDAQGFQFIIGFLIMPLFFLSGAMFPLDNLPKALTILTRLDPALLWRGRPASFTQWRGSSLWSRH